MGLWRRHGGRGRGACRPVEIQVWHTLTDANKAEFEKLAKQYNKEQDQVSVTLRALPRRRSCSETTAAVKAKKAPICCNWPTTVRPKSWPSTRP